jgi:hypothetical protein
MLMLLCVLCVLGGCLFRMTNFLFFPRKVLLPQGSQGFQYLAVNLDCALFADVVIPESPEAYVKLTENAIRNTSGRREVSILPSSP